MSIRFFGNLESGCQNNITMKLFFKPIRNLIIGGVFFIIPLILLIIIITKALSLLKPLVSIVMEKTGLEGFFGAATATVFGVTIIVMISAIAGFLLQSGLIGAWGTSFEEWLFIHAPGLQAKKFLMQGDKEVHAKTKWVPVLFQEEHYFRLGFITNEFKEADILSLFIPDYPKLNSGEVRYYRISDLKYKKISMKEAAASFNHFGKGVNLTEPFNV